MCNTKCFIIPVIIGATGIVTKGLKKIPRNFTRKAFNRFSTKKSCTRNITHYKESATIGNLKPEWWGSPLVQEENYQEKPVKREWELLIIIIFIIIICICCVIIKHFLKMPPILVVWRCITCQIGAFATEQRLSLELDASFIRAVLIYLCPVDFHGPFLCSRYNAAEICRYYS
jgi:hypothetical protein